MLVLLSLFCCLFVQSNSVYVCVCFGVWVCVCVCSHSVWLKQTPDKALIITEEQGYVNDKVLILFWTFLKKEMLSSIHPYMIGVGFKKHDILTSTIRRSAECFEATLTSFTVQTRFAVTSDSQNWNEWKWIPASKLWRRSFLSAVNCEDQCYVTLKSCAGVSVCYPEFWVSRHT